MRHRISDDRCDMLAAPTPAAAASLAPPAQKNKPQTFFEIFKSLGITALKICAGYLALLALLTAIHFPYRVDEPGSPKVRGDAGAFYTDIYSAAAPQKAAPEVPASAEDSRYVKLARAAIKNERIVPKITAFAEQYGLAGKRVLDVGAGTGYLQDVVPDYVGLDISPSARGYFHKPFVEASATDMPFRDNEFDALWSVWVLEHVPKPEQALVEIRRVVKDGGVLFLKPAWSCPWWLSQGYEVRPYSDFDLIGKLRKASLTVVKSPYYRGASMIPTRYLRQIQARWSGKPTRFHYSLLEPNYDKYWVTDADAVNSLDYFEMLLWFTSRGDECLNCDADPLWDADELILRIHKK
jgi:SAM-dependent methyltransferase